MKSEEIRRKFLEFFRKRDHLIVPSSSLVPENDSSVLFNTAGMQPLVPYLMGNPHPSGLKRIANIQKCLRTVDIDEVGDNTHLTFFEMMGNWSLGDYFKKEAISWSFEFLTSEKEGLGLDPRRLYVTVFEGDENAPKDVEAYQVWKEIFEKVGLDASKRIFEMNADANWWSPGESGPCGPDSEMFYDVSGKLTDGMTREEFIEADERQDLVEIWNDVFMEYEKENGKVIGKLKNQNVDTGSGMERVVCVVQNKKNVFDTDLFEPIMDKINFLSKKENLKSKRIIADHLRASVFLIADGVIPSNTDQGYILRRLLRRAIRHADRIEMPVKSMEVIALIVVEKYREFYPEVKNREEEIVETVKREEDKFRKTIEKGMRIFDKIDGKVISGKDVFILFSTYGFPVELTEELAKEKGLEIDKKGFKEEMEKHQSLSREGSQGKFKGGISGESEKTTQLHTLTHLLLSGLRKYLGEDVYQAGSNITEERIRFDFTYPQKVERGILDEIEKYINSVILEKCKIESETMGKEIAKKSEVVGSFWERYPDKVTIYTIKNSEGFVYSKELCGGPHINNTEEIKGRLKIIKEESVSAGVRRIKAVIA